MKPIAVLRMKTPSVGGGGGGATPVVRGSAIQWMNFASSATVTLPAGSAAGDTAILFAANGWPANNPSGWTVLDNSVGDAVNGATYNKNLSSGDISTGSVTITFTNGYYGVVALVVITGAASVRTQTDARNTTGATSRTLTTDGTPVSGDLALWFTMGRASITITCSDGTQIRTVTNTDGSGVLNSQALGSSGAASGHFSYSSAPTGDYQSVVVLNS